MYHIFSIQNFTKIEKNKIISVIVIKNFFIIMIFIEKFLLVFVFVNFRFRNKCHLIFNRLANLDLVY